MNTLLRKTVDISQQPSRQAQKCMLWDARAPQKQRMLRQWCRLISRKCNRDDCCLHCTKQCSRARDVYSIRKKRDSGSTPCQRSATLPRRRQEASMALAVSTGKSPAE
mmetsp:Transcript_80013/g.212380  ORF Transcript_80013/g.212380 Transcript_80013/m.212380 type:complete len:108 (-) Transcript_80013:216-539(-)